MMASASRVVMAVAVLHMVLMDSATGIQEQYSLAPSIKFNVLNFGAAGDGVKDDSEAFKEAWRALCSSTAIGIVPRLYVPGKRQYLLHPITFKGPCNSSRVDFQISGRIIAPESPSAWEGLDAGQWLSFEGIDGLTVWGHRGRVNGRGQRWWSQSCRYQPKSNCTIEAPTAMKFLSCNDLKVVGISIKNSSQTHITTVGCDRVSLSSFTVDSPGDSPNTDGVHIHRCRNVTVHNATIRAGDDCISIGDQVFGVNITNIACGPGHGISIGSLGRDKLESSVENINVRDVKFVNTTNGARIKTWQGGKGYVRSVRFENITVADVENPIIIDQYYCDVKGSCPPEPTAVSISDVTYMKITGTSSSQVAVSLNCSLAVGCSSISLDDIDLKPDVEGRELTSVCINAHGNATGVVNPPVGCL